MNINYVKFPITTLATNAAEIVARTVGKGTVFISENTMGIINRYHTITHRLQRFRTMVERTKSGLEHTAYLTSCERAMFPELSRDAYAHHWIPAETWPLLDEFLKCRSFSPILVAARNRYFLERMKSFFAHGEGLLINVAAGMSSYPFLLGEQIEHVEIDSPHMINHKRRIRDALQMRGLLPKRTISYAVCDLNTRHSSQLIRSIMEKHKNKRTFILFEGIVYYLSPKQLWALCDVVDTYPTESDTNVGFVYWEQSLRHHPFLLDYQSFIQRVSGVRYTFNFHRASDFECNFTAYKQLDSGRFRDLVPSFGGPHLEDTIFSENYIILGN